MADGDPWTLQVGIADVLKFLARRTPWALLVWFVAALPLCLWAKAGTIAGELSFFTIMIAFLGAGAGVPVGAICARGILEAAGFVGWIPSGLALLGALLAVALGTLAASAIVGLEAPFLRALLIASGSSGAAGAVLKSTWADA